MKVSFFWEIHNDSLKLQKKIDLMTILINFELPLCLNCYHVDIKVAISKKYGWNTIVWAKIRHLRHFVQNLLGAKFHTSSKIRKFYWHLLMLGDKWWIFFPFSGVLHGESCIWSPCFFINYWEIQPRYLWWNYFLNNFNLFTCFLLIRGWWYIVSYIIIIDQNVFLWSLFFNKSLFITSTCCINQFLLLNAFLFSSNLLINSTCLFFWPLNFLSFSILFLIF